MRAEDKEKEVWRFLSEFHQALIRNIHDYQRNFTQLLVAVIAGMAAFGYGAKVYLSDPCPQNAIFFSICTLGTIILLRLVITMANISGYQHRMLQGVMWKIEEVFKVTRGGSPTMDRGNDQDLRVVPASWNPFKKDKIDPPEVYKKIKLIAILLITICIVLFFAIIFLNATKNLTGLLIWSLLTIVILGLSICLVICCKLYQKLFKCSSAGKLEELFRHLGITPRENNRDK